MISFHEQPRSYKYDLKSPGHKPKNQAGTISRSGKPRFPWTISEISGSASSIDFLQTPSSPNPDLVMVSSPKPTQYHTSDEDETEMSSHSPKELKTATKPLPPALPPKDYPPPPPVPPKHPGNNPIPLPPRSKTPPNLKSNLSVKNSIPLPPKESSNVNLLPLPPKGGGNLKQNGRHSVPAIYDSDLLPTNDKAPPLPPKGKC